MRAIGTARSPGNGTSPGSEVHLPQSFGMGWRLALGLYVTFAAGAVAITWPLALAPGSQIPYHHDPLVFTWVMTSIARRLISSPLTLFHGDAFYPFGQSLAFNERLLPQTLLGFPGFVWGNPVLTYNLLLLFLLPLNGLTMAWAAYTLTRSRPAAAVAGAVFSLSPYFAEYHINFQMLQAAGLPVALVAWVRWLETQERRWLWATLGAITYTGLSTVYYTVILSVAMITLTTGVWALRWRGFAWRRNLTALILGGAGVTLVLVPFALPYLAARQELGFERSLSDTIQHRAVFGTFFHAGGRSVMHRTGQPAETSDFVGSTAGALALVGLVWLRRDPRLPRGAVVLTRLAVLGLLADILVLVIADYSPPHRRYLLGSFKFRPRAAEALYVAILLGVLLLLIRGWAHWRAKRPRAFSHGDWVRLLLLAAGVLAILALGPRVLEGEHIGPYETLYNLYPPLAAVRILVRFGIISVAALALLAAFGLRAIEDGLRGHPRLWRVVLVIVAVGFCLDYAVRPVRYDPLVWHTRGVDAVLRADPEDVAVLEYPAWAVGCDSRAMLQSLVNEKRLVNGYSGFTPDLLRDVADVLGDPGPASTEAQAMLRRIYPLRYLVVRWADPDFHWEWLATWAAFRSHPMPPLYRFRGTYGTDDLYELNPTPEDGWDLERLISYDFIRHHPALDVTVQPRATGADLEEWADLSLNGRALRTVSLSAPVHVEMALAPPLNTAAPNRVELRFRYRRPPGALDGRYRIGGTGVLSPGDLRVMSAGQPYGNASAIELNGEEQGAPRRGYNLVALDGGGYATKAATFDTFDDPAANTLMAAWIDALPTGTVVGGAVQDEASRNLTETGVRALGTLGVAGDLRGRYRYSHAFIGVKGAPPGAALESLGPRQLVVSVGRVERSGSDFGRLGLKLTAFALHSPPARP